jgi:hypothetical protein
MTAPPTPSSRIRHVALAASLALLAGCGGDPPVNDTAEIIKPEPAKPAPVPVSTQTPETTPPKDVPKH